MMIALLRHILAANKQWGYHTPLAKNTRTGIKLLNIYIILIW